MQPAAEQSQEGASNDTHDLHRGGACARRHAANRARANTTGIQFNSGGSLTVQDSAIRNFTTEGITFQPRTSNLSQLFVSNTLLSDTNGHGVDIAPGGTETTKSVLDHVKMQNNGGAGLVVQTPISTQTINVPVSDSVSAGNGQSGIVAVPVGGTINIMVRNSTVANNGFGGLEADGSGATIRVTRSTITGNSLG